MNEKIEVKTRCNKCHTCVLVEALWCQCWSQNPTERPNISTILITINNEINAETIPIYLSL